MSDTDVRSPGGWLRLYAVRIASTLLVGSVGAAVVVTMFGTQNGGQIEHACQGALSTSAAANGVAFSCRNPFSGTAALLVSYDEGVVINEAITVAGNLDVGVASNATASGTNVFDNLNFAGARRFVPTATSGSTVRTSGIVLVGSGKFLNGKWGITTSGATLSGRKPGIYSFKWINASDISSSLDL